MRSHILFLGLVTACGGGGGGDPGDPDGAPDVPDATPRPDAETQAPTMITISGIAGEGGLSGTTPVQGVSVALFAASNDSTPIATDTSDASGAFSFTIETDGTPVDAYIKATSGAYVDAYVYPPAPFSDDATGNDINMITQSNFDLLSTFAGGNQQPSMGFIAMAVVDENGAAVSGATVASSPAAATYRYDDSNGYPSSSATSTASDGFSFMFNVPGHVTVSASKPGLTFRSHAVFARPGAFTTTAIAP